MWILLVLLAQPMAEARGIQVNRPAAFHGVRVTDVHYDAQDQSYEVAGRLDGAPVSTWPADYRIRINGHDTVGVPIQGSPGSFGFLDHVALGAGSPYWTNDSYEQAGVWMWQWFEDPWAIAKPILIEIVDTRDRSVALRKRLTVYDLRASGDTEISRSQVVLGEARAADVSLRGLGQLSDVHTSTLFHPRPQSYDNDLDEVVPGLPYRVHGVEDRSACTSVNNLDPRFLLTQPYLDTFQEALDEYEDFLAKAGSGNPILIAEAAAMCVQLPPLPVWFEVCTHRVEGDLTSIDVDDVLHAGLGVPSAGGALGVDVELTGVQASAQALLRDLEVRWTAGLPACTGRPDRDIDNSLITSHDWFDEWATCADLELLADGAYTDALVEYAVQPDVAEPTSLLVTRQRGAGFDRYGTAEVLGTGTCSEGWIEVAIETYLGMHAPSVGEGLSLAWGLDAPYTDEADALDLLLSDLDTSPVFLPFVEADETYEPVLIDRDLGLQLTWTTAVDPVSVGAQQELSAGFFYTPPYAIPDFPGGIDHSGTLYGVAVHLTTGYLNQHLRALAATNALREDLHPSYDQLGLVAPPSVSSSDPAELNGVNLSYWMRPLQVYGQEELTFRVAPSRDPFTWMPDAGGVRPEEYPLTYHLPHLLVELWRTEPGLPERMLIRTVVDFYDPGLRLTIDPAPGADTLQAALGRPVMKFTTLSTAFPACRPTSHAHRGVPTGDCEEIIEQRFGELLRPLLLERMRELVDEIPLPHLFDAAEQASSTAQLVQTGRHAGGQVLTLFADLQ